MFHSNKFIAESWPKTILQAAIAVAAVAALGAVAWLVVSLVSTTTKVSVGDATREINAALPVGSDESTIKSFLKQAGYDYYKTDPQPFSDPGIAGLETEQMVIRGRIDDTSSGFLRSWHIELYFVLDHAGHLDRTYVEKVED